MVCVERVVVEERGLSSGVVGGVCREGGVEELDYDEKGEFWVWAKEDVSGVKGENVVGRKRCGEGKTVEEEEVLDA